MFPPQDSSNRLSVGRRLLGAISPLVPSRARFRFLGLPATELKGAPTGLISGYHAEPGPMGVVHHLRNGIAWARGAHLDARYRLIHGLSPSITLGMDFWMLKRQRFLPRLNRIPQETVSLIADGHKNYYHWILDVLPRLAALDPDRLSKRHYLICQDHPFHRQTLDLLQVPPSARTAATGLQFYTAPELLIPLRPLGVSQENVRFVRNLLMERTGLANSPIAGERIYISRHHATSRRVVNEDELEPLLKKHHFRTCYLEQLSLKEQMLLFHGAETILAPHGAAWTNLVFARPGTRALEIVPEGLDRTDTGPYHLYEQLAAVADARYERLIAQATSPDYPHAGDVNLKAETLRRVLQQLD